VRRRPLPASSPRRYEGPRSAGAQQLAPPADPDPGTPPAKKTHGALLDGGRSLHLNCVCQAAAAVRFGAPSRFALDKHPGLGLSVYLGGGIRSRPRPPRIFAGLRGKIKKTRDIHGCLLPSPHSGKTFLLDGSLPLEMELCQGLC
jgi:hypothetical protein